jgi:hypothetical protein
VISAECAAARMRDLVGEVGRSLSAKLDLSVGIAPIVAQCDVAALMAPADRHMYLDKADSR